MEKDTLKDDREDFKTCLDAESEQRKDSQDDLEFAKLSKQWDERDVSQRREEGRPCLTINRLPSFIKQVTNDGRMNRPSIAVKPVGSGASKHTADIQSDLIRNIETQSQADIVYDTAFDFAVTCGFGYYRINVDYACDDAWDQDILLDRINNPFSVYGDWESKQATSIDWNRAYVTDWYSKSAFEAKWGKGRKASSFDDGSSEYDQHWFQDKRIRVAERWLREEVPAKLLKLSDGTVIYEDELLKNQEFFTSQGLTVVSDRDTKTYKVKQRLITGTDVLEENDWLGKYIPIVPMYGEEVNINGKRYFISLVRRAKDPQRMFNYHRSAVAEVLGLTTKTPWLIAEGQVENHTDQWQNANRVPYPYLAYTHVEGVPPPQRLAFSGVPIGDMQAAMADSDDMKAIMGLYDASLGARSNETSGRAIMARQREGDTSTFDFLDNRNRAVEHGGRIILDLIPKVFTAERILRCVQEDGSTYTVPVNQPVAPKQDLEQIRQIDQPYQPSQQRPEGPPEYVPVPQELQMALPPERIAQLKAITKVFDLTVGKYDVTVTAGPGFTTRREEAATQMMEFIRIFPQAAPLIGDLLAKNLDWPGADQVAERLKAMLPPQAQGQVNPMVKQLQDMLQAQDAQAKQAVAQLQGQIAELTKQVQDKAAEQQIKAGELKVKGFEAETRRIEVLKPEAPQAPEQIDPVEVEKLRLEQEKLRIKAYEAETARLQALGSTITPEAIAALVQQTVAQALANAPAVEKSETIVVAMPEEMPMGEMGEGMMGGMQGEMQHMMPDGSMMAGPPMDEMSEGDVPNP